MKVLTPKPPKTKEAVKTVLYRPPPGLLAEVDVAASAANLSRNEAITQLLRFALDAHNSKGKK